LPESSARASGLLQVDVVVLEQGLSATCRDDLRDPGTYPVVGTWQMNDFGFHVLHPHLLPLQSIERWVATIFIVLHPDSQVR
jgi:hypothetical protein